MSKCRTTELQYFMVHFGIVVPEVWYWCHQKNGTTVLGKVTGQLADMPTRGLPTRRLDISWTGQLTD